MQAPSIGKLLENAKTIAVVGLSAKPERASYEVAAYLQKHGYRIIPVNSGQAGRLILGERCYASLTQAVQETGLPIDIVDCFRKSEDIPALAEEAIAVGAGCLWMQLAIKNQAAASRAESAGMQVIMDKCTKIEHALHFSGTSRKTSKKEGWKSAWQIRKNTGNLMRKIWPSASTGRVIRKSIPMRSRLAMPTTPLGTSSLPIPKSSAISPLLIS